MASPLHSAKTSLLNLAKSCGYHIQRIPKPGEDIELYRQLHGQAAIDGRRFYNIGAGGFYHPAWTNVDMPSDYYAPDQADRINISWNLLDLTPLDVEDNIAEAVYTSHTIEHVTDEAAANLFRQAYRILKPGGCFRITCPDVDLAYGAWQRNDRAFFAWYDLVYSRPEEMARIGLTMPMREASLSQIFLFQVVSATSTLHGDGAEKRIDDASLTDLFRRLPYEAALDACVAACPFAVRVKHPYNHVNWWNPAKVLRFLKDAGFETAWRSGYGQSTMAVLRNTSLFDWTRSEWSLYVEARK
jgi:SAM-dependent methyltransferase